jgi:putative endonuclease
MWYVYVILCEGGTFYTGIAKSVEARFKVHLKGKGARYTRINKPVKIIYQEQVESVSDALKRERQIKKWHGAQKIKKLGLKLEEL